jgi:hypothetical protein
MYDGCCEVDVGREAVVLLSARMAICFRARQDRYAANSSSSLHQQQAKSWELRAAMSLARLWRDQAKAQQALEWDKPDNVARSVHWRKFDQEEQLRVKPKQPLKKRHPETADFIRTLQRFF